MEIYLVRHTTPSVAKGTCYGQADLDVTDSFKSEMHKLKLHLPKQIDILYSSPLQRCKLQANELIPNPQLDERLMEMSFGDWELCEWDEIDKEAIGEWMNDFVEKRPPGGESFKDLEARVLDFWHEVSDFRAQKPIVISTHGGVIRVIVCHILGIPLVNAFKFHLDYGSVTKIALHNQLHRLEFINR